MSWPYPPDRLNRIENALLRVLDHATATAISNQLPKSISDNIGVKTASTPLEIAQKFAKGCGKFPAGLHELLAAVQRVEQGTYATIQLEFEINLAHNPSALGDEAWDDLWRVATSVGIHGREVAEAWKTMLGETSAIGPSSVTEAIARLPKFNSQNIITFLKELDARLPEDVRFSPLIDRLEVELALGGRRTSPAESSRHDERQTLLIRLSPDSSGKHFAVRAWIMRPPQRPKPIEPSSGREDSATLQALPGIAADLIDQARSSKNAKLAVAFMVPNALLGHEFERWRAPFGLLKDGKETEIGHEHPVVLYSLERWRDRAMHARLDDKWSRGVETRQNSISLRPTWIHRHEHEPNAISIFQRAEDGRWVPTGPDPAYAYSYEQLYFHLTEEDQGIVVVLSLDPGHADEVKEVFTNLLTAGTPIAVWLRRHLNDPANAPAWLHDALAHGDPRTLPEAVRRARRAAVMEPAAEHDQHPGRHLTLLYEDPACYPPLRRLAAPTIGGRSA